MNTPDTGAALDLDEIEQRWGCADRSKDKPYFPYTLAPDIPALVDEVRRLREAVAHSKVNDSVLQWAINACDLTVDDRAYISRADLRTRFLEAHRARRGERPARRPMRDRASTRRYIAATHSERSV